MQDLEKWFDKARVPVNIEKEPLSSISRSVNNKDIFQMTIDTRGKKNKREYFRIFYGHNENDVRIIDTDSKKQQVILLIQEPEREYSIRSWDREKRVWVYNKQKSPGFLRKYLMGMDESHLFIAELPKNLGVINKVKDAHKALKPNLIKDIERKIGKIKRQGEWFFIPADDFDLDLIERNRPFVEKKKRISPRLGGNPHIADQILRIEVPRKTYVLGRIAHVEHKTLTFNMWHKVARNNEARTTAISGNQIFNGVKWVD